MYTLGILYMDLYKMCILYTPGVSNVQLKICLEHDGSRFFIKHSICRTPGSSRYLGESKGDYLLRGS